MKRRKERWREVCFAGSEAERSKRPRCELRPPVVEVRKSEEDGRKTRGEDKQKILGEDGQKTGPQDRRKILEEDGQKAWGEDKRKILEEDG